MNALQMVSRIIIRESFHLSVRLIEKFHDTSIHEQKVKQLQQLSDGTLGKDIAKCLEENGLRLIPNYESHDLKHVLLDFKMTPVDEIRMQAFMLGNGNYSIPTIAILIFGMILLPDLWTRFFKDFRKGTKSKSIRMWTLEEYAHFQTSILKQIALNSSLTPQTTSNMSTFIKFSSYIGITFGSLGMLVCLPFLFSSNIEDLVGAGFTFIGGAIIASAGLITLSHSTKPTNSLTTTLTAQFTEAKKL